jgi:hypothetical protein
VTRKILFRNQILSCQQVLYYNRSDSGATFSTLRFFVTYKWTQKVRVLHYTRLERLVRDTRSSVLDPFVTYKENVILLLRPRGLFYESFTLVIDISSVHLGVRHFHWVKSIFSRKYCQISLFYNSYCWRRLSR